MPKEALRLEAANQGTPLCESLMKTLKREELYANEYRAPYQNEYFNANCSWRIVLADVITPKVCTGVTAEEGAFQFG
jgi:hypothetical protein